MIKSFISNILSKTIVLKGSSPWGRLGGAFSLRQLGGVLSFLFFSLAVCGQPASDMLTGKVLDNNGDPLAGATVKVKLANGAVTNTFSNGDGVFSIGRTGTERSITVAFIGFKPQTQMVKRGKTSYTFTMEDDNNAIDEVVVTGYNTIDKRKLTSSITSISEKDLTLKGALTVDQMIEGKIPGLMSSTTTTAPGAQTKMRIRGSNTFTGSRQPLWVVDGMIYEDPVPLTADEINSWDNINLIGNAISGLNPQDIARIYVLKDASATALYGTRAANGVIVVTTKTGQLGKPHLNYNLNAQWQLRPSYSDYNLMTSKERIDVSREILEKGLYFDSYPSQYGYEGATMSYWKKEMTFDEYQAAISQMESNNTDWFDELYRNTFSQTHNVSLSGGTPSNRYYASVGFNNDRGSEINQSLQRLTARLNISTHLRQNLTIDMRLNGSYQKGSYNTSYYSIFNEAYYTNRIFAARNADGSLAYIDKYITEDQTTQQKVYGKYNILNELQNSGNRVTNKSLNLTVQANWEILPNLRYSGTVGLSTTTNMQENWINENTYYCSTLRGYDLGNEPRSDSGTYSYLPSGGIWSAMNTDQRNILWRNQLNYNFTLKDIHQFNFDLGHEMSSVKYRGNSTGENPGYQQSQGESFNSVWAGSYADAEQYYWYLRYWYMASGTGSKSSPSITDQTSNTLSFYLTATYSLKNYFSFNVNARNDASNKFGQYEKEKFNPVWSTSARWNIHEMSFLKGTEDWLDMLALRASYGYRGTVPNATPYLIISTPKTSSISGELASSIKSYPNASLKWEKTSTVNVGLDYSILKGRISGALEAFYSRSTDLISSRAASLVNGTSSLYYNDGIAENKGVEFSISTVNIRTKDFRWRTSLNYSYTTNVIKRGSYDSNTYTDYINGSVVLDGASVDGFYSYRFDSLDGYGLPRFKGLTGNEAGLTRDEFLSRILVYSGSRTPKHYGGFSTEFQYKDFSLRAEFTYKLNYKTRLLSLYQSGKASLPMPEDNMNSVFVNRWRQAGDEANTTIPGLTNVELSVPSQNTSVSAQYEYLYTMVDDEYRYWAGPSSYTGWYMYDNSDLRVADASHIRFKSITAGWQLPKRWLKPCGLDNARLDFQVQNIGVWAFDSKLKGQDPDQVASIGIPTLPSFNVTLNVGF